MDEIIIDKNIVDAAPDKIVLQQETLSTQGSGSKITSYSDGVSIVSKNIQSPNFKKDNLGWSFSSSGTSEINGAITVSTNFNLVFKVKGISLYVSDGTTPNGNLLGNTGDICLNGPSGQPFKCTSTTTWVGL